MNVGLLPARVVVELVSALLEKGRNTTACGLYNFLTISFLS